ncbi:hypothetical protein GCM10027419_46340 [Pandoraea terrae]
MDGRYLSAAIRVRGVGVELFSNSSTWQTLPASEFEDRVNLHGYAARKGVASDRGACMAASVSQDRDNQIRCAIQDLGVVLEISGRIDKPAEPDATDDVIKISADRLIDLRQNIDRTDLCGCLPFFEGKICTKLADVLVYAAGHRNLAGYVEQIAHPLGRGKIGPRGDGRGRFDAEIAQPLFETSAHH